MFSQKGSKCDSEKRKKEKEGAEILEMWQKF